MRFKEWLINIAELLFYNPKWTCNSCGVEIFKGEYFCDKCKSELPLNQGYICEHCGRKTNAPETYCLTCKNRLLSIDMGRSVFIYKKPISGMIKRLKYKKKRYIAEILGEYLSLIYFKHYMASDIIVYPPMTEKAERKREYNHAKLLAEKLSSIVNVPVLDVIAKTKETDRQAKLGKEERLKNLVGVFKITDKKSVKDKTILIVDDVTTTGATAEVIADRLKKAGAKKVMLLTVASVPSIE